MENLENFKGFEFINKLMEDNEQLSNLINTNVALGKIRYFGEEEWEKIKKQNFVNANPEIKGFYDIFQIGDNKYGNRAEIVKQLSFSYNNVSIAGGELSILKDTKNDGSHTWLETNDHIIDPTLLLIIDLSLKNELGYVTQNIVTAEMLAGHDMYQARKEFVNDSSLKK